MKFDGKTNYFQLGDKESLYIANVRLLGAIRRWEKIKWLARAIRWLRRHRIPFPVDFYGAGYSVFHDGNIEFNASVRNESGENGNIFQSREVWLTWDEIKDLNCCVCGRQIALGEWSHIQVEWWGKVADIKRRCNDCLTALPKI